MILVTGGTGFLGAHLLLRLINEKHSIRAIYRQEKKLDVVKRVFSYYCKNENELFSKIEWVKSDLNNIPSLTEAFEGITHVYHCAAFVSFEPDKFKLLRQTNIKGTANIVNLCISEKVKKLCHVSSVASIGSSKKGEQITEKTEWDAEANNSVYSITKYGAELEVWRGTQEGLDAIIVNPGIIVGPGIWKYGSGNFFKRIYKGLDYYSSGAMGYVGVNDVVKCMVHLMDSSIVNNRFILVAENLSYQQFIISVAQALNVKHPTKEVKPILLEIGWRLDWLKQKVTGKRRILTKSLAKTLVSKLAYDNSKVKTQLSFNFKTMNAVVKDTAKCFLNDIKT